MDKVVQSDSNKTDKEPISNISFFRRTRLYLLEYVLYHSFLILLLSYIVYTFYALFWVVAGKPLNSGLAEANVWFMAGSFVFIPLTYIVYTRTRWEELRSPMRFKQPLRVVITYMQLIIGLIAGITFALIMFINLLRFIIGFTDASSLLTLVIPSAINTAVMTVVVFDILSSRSQKGLKLFRPIFFGLCVLATVILLTLTAIFGRSGGYDRQTMKDLIIISEKINQNHNYGDSVETDLSKLGLPGEVLNRSKERNYKIKYANTFSDKYSSSSYRSSNYQLCANFKNSTMDSSRTSSYRYTRSTLLVNDDHSAGEYCFELNAS